MLNAVVRLAIRETFESVVVPIAVAAIGAYAVIRASEIGAIAAMNSGEPEEEPAPPKRPTRRRKPSKR